MRAPVRFVAALATVAAAAASTAAPAGAAVSATPLSVLDVPALGATATAAVARTCSAQLLPNGTAGAQTRRVTVPVSGFLDARLTGSPRGPDWDLAVFDVASGQLVGASDAFGAGELVEAPITAGQVLAIQACRYGGAGGAAVGLSVRDVVVGGARATPRTESLVAIRWQRPEQLDALARQGIDLNETARGHTIGAVLHGPADVARLRSSGLAYRVEVPDLNAADRAGAAATARAAAARSALPSGRTTYRQLVDYENDMKALVRDHPSLARPVIIGTSVQGRTIEGIELARNVHAAADGRPTHVEMGLHHAREWSSGEVPMEFAIDLVRHSGSDATISRLLRVERTFVFPVINVDGFAETMESGGYNAVLDDGTGSLTAGPEAADQGAYKRKNCQDANHQGATDPLPCSQRTGGVDLNRNYGAFWGGPGESDNPLMPTYRGPAPFSEPETQAVHAWSSRHQVMVINSNHNYEGDVLYQPGFNRSDEPGLKRGTKIPQQAQMKAVADAMARAEGYTSKVSYELYDVTGATEDWNYFAQNAFGYTTELGHDDFHVDYQDAVIDQYLGTVQGALDKRAGRRPSQGNRRAMIVAGEAAARPAYHAVISGRARPGRRLTLAKDFTTSTSNVESQTEGSDTVGAPMLIPEHLSSTLIVPRSGRFAWHVDPSTRPVALLAGKREAWTLRCGRRARRIVVAMGHRVRLGRVC